MQHNNEDGRVLICLKTVMINKIYYTGEKNEQKRANRNTEERLAR